MKETEIKLFGKWSVEGIEVSDPGLRRYVNINAVIVPKSSGRHSRKQFHKSKMSIVERLINKMMVPGHRGRKHTITSGSAVGKYFTNYNTIKKVFERIELATKKNPLEVLVKAIENAAPREEIANYQVGGIIVRRAVTTSPQRRVDTSLKNIAQAAYRKSFGKKDTIVDSLTNEIIGAYNNERSKSEAVNERERQEKEAEGAR